VNHPEEHRSALPGVAEEVQHFYERMPYPAPLTSLDEYRDPAKNAALQRATFRQMWPTDPPRENLEVLIAGCGTSQAAKYALREPKARVIGIDLSETSLRHTRELQRKYKLENLELHQLPIERVGELGRSFDLVVSTGVLHHLPDPDQGLRALRTVLNPNGAMRLMVYARYGRTGIYMLQEYCRLLGVLPSEKDLLTLGDTLGALPGDHPIAGLLRKAKDFRLPDAMADALLHPQDRAYTVPEVYEWLDRCGMSFGRWMEQAPYLPQCGMVAKSAHAARLSSLSPQAQHAAVELFRGTMVTHSFIAYRDDRAGESQPITFAGDRWRNYVPIRMPSAVTVRERLPEGCTAVLINRAHTFTDLLCTVNAFEDGLLSGIDGKRTLAEILTFARANPTAELRAIAFFEKLWRYDQVVF
jgi:SAM-dependent methyltransferase